MMNITQYHGLNDECFPGETLFSLILRGVALDRSGLGCARPAPPPFDKLRMNGRGIQMHFALPQAGEPQDLPNAVRLGRSVVGMPPPVVKSHAIPLPCPA